MCVIRGTGELPHEVRVKLALATVFWALLALFLFRQAGGGEGIGRYAGHEATARFSKRLSSIVWMGSRALLTTNLGQLLAQELKQIRIGYQSDRLSMLINHGQILHFTLS